MYEQTTKKAPLNTILEEMYNTGRRLAYFDKETSYSIWDREIKKTREVKVDKESPEYLEFIKQYRKINNNGSYDTRLIKKYHDAIKEKPHKEIMQNLEDYKKHLKAFDKPALQVWTYLNRKGYLETWQIVKVDFSKAWIDNLCKERWYSAEFIEHLVLTVKARETKNNKEVTAWVLENLIDSII